MDLKPFETPVGPCNLNGRGTGTSQRISHSHPYLCTFYFGLYHDPGSVTEDDGLFRAPGSVTEDCGLVEPQVHFIRKCT